MVSLTLFLAAFGPSSTRYLQQPYSSDAGPGRRLAPPGRLKRVLDKAHLHLGDLLPDPLRVAHLRSRSEQLRVGYKDTTWRSCSTLRRRCCLFCAPLSAFARNARHLMNEVMCEMNIRSGTPCARPATVCGAGTYRGFGQ
jgi:hypothetical protein